MYNCHESDSRWTESHTNPISGMAAAAGVEAAGVEAAGAAVTAAVTVTAAVVAAAGTAAGVGATLHNHHVAQSHD